MSHEQNRAEYILELIQIIGLRSQQSETSAVFRYITCKRILDSRLISRKSKLGGGRIPIDFDAAKGEKRLLKQEINGTMSSEYTWHVGQIKTISLEVHAGSSGISLAFDCIFSSCLLDCG